MIPVLLVVLSALLVLSGFYILGLRKTYSGIVAERASYIQQTIESERRAAHAETERDYMKITLANVLQRPAVVNMTDDNIAQLGAIIESMIKPERMN